MSKSPSTYAAIIIGAIMWCVGGGVFLEARLPFGHDPLFWPLWICVSAIVWLGVLLLDAYWERRRRRRRRP